MRSSRISSTLSLAVAIYLAGAIDVSGRQPTSNHVEDTQFNYKRGFYSSSFTVVIQSNTAGARIFYTIDGSVPTPTTGLGGHNPVSVFIDKTTTLRAIATKDGMIPTNVDTQTYIFMEDILSQPSSIRGYPRPVLENSIREAVEFDYGMNPTIVNDPRYQRAIRQGLRSIPTLSLVTDKDNLFLRVHRPNSHLLDQALSGAYWSGQGKGRTVPVSVEMIDSRSGTNLQVDAALEGHSWRLVKRAFRLKFQKEYGAAKWESSIFQDAPLNGDTATDTYDRIVLRSGKNRSWATDWAPARTCYTRDQWARDTQITMSGAGSHGTFVHLYLNGIYWGLYNACERPDEWFAARYWGGREQDWFSVNHDGARRGDPSRWNYLRGVLKDRDMNESAYYQELLKYLDVTQFADYIILCWYIGLGDWPGNNWYAVNRTEPPSPTRFFLWDAEVSWDTGPTQPGQVHPQFRAAAQIQTPDMVGIWHSLKKSKEFMTVFSDRVFKHCFNQGALSEDHAITRWRTLTDFIADAVVAESARWGGIRHSVGGPTFTRDDNFSPEVERVARLMESNVEQFIESLRSEGYYPTIDPPRHHLETSFLRSSTMVLDNLNESGMIYYTLNGTDPRLAGGAVSSEASESSDTAKLNLKGGSRLMARVRQGTTWSALLDVSIQP